MVHTYRNKCILILLSLMFVVLAVQQHTAEACSSRTIPKPRPSTSSSSSTSSITATPAITTEAATTTTTTTTTTPRPNITFPTYKCPDTFDTWYCLNDATCFSVKIGESIMYNCECAIGFMGPRCEFKELDGSYLPKRPRPMLEKASIASGATCALLFMLIICVTLYLRYDQKARSFDHELNTDDEDELSSMCTAKCRYCNDKNCCSDADTELLTAGGYTFRQHIETIPMSFAIKRSTKL